MLTSLQQFTPTAREMLMDSTTDNSKYGQMVLPRVTVAQRADP